jgi:ubiquinone/menaquinone biosynthesis C-methylase UbiE
LGGALYLAPVGEPANVLDIGTGTGIWAIEFAAEHPTSNVIGSDLSLIQPTDPPVNNVSFVREDAEEDDWYYGLKFDYIHLRGTVTCFTHPEKVIANCTMFVKMAYQERADDIRLQEPKPWRMGRVLRR